MTPQSSTGTAELRQAVALEIWHRFADSNVQEWEDETHKAEYLLCADDIIALCQSSRPAQSSRERALEAAAMDFVAKVDRGEAKSKRSYAAFTAALALPSTDR